MNIQKLLQRCRDRHFKSLTQIRTAMRPISGYINHKHIPHIRYAHRKSAPATAFGDAGISIIPIRKERIGLDGERQTATPICKFSAALNSDTKGWDPWKTTFKFDHWEEGYWRQSWGIQAFTGYPSGYWTDLDFEWDAVEQHPHETGICIAQLLQLAEEPLLTISKSGGLRFSCRTPGYIHPRAESDRIYAARYADDLDEDEQPIREYLFMEIFGDKGLTRWDARYEIVCGNLLRPPTIQYSEIFKVLRHFRSAVHRPAPRQVRKSTPVGRKTTQRVANSQSNNVEKWTLDNLPSDLNWVKDRDGGLKSKRGDYKCTMRPHPKSGGRNLQFYMDKYGNVAIFCHNCRGRSAIGKYGKSGGDRLAEIIDNAPPYEEIPSREEQRESKINRIRNYDVPTLELRRPPTILFKRDDDYEYTTLDANDKEIRDAFDREERLIVLNSETGAGKNFQMEEAVLSGLKIIKTSPTKPLAAADEQRMRSREIDVSLWKPRNWMADIQRERSEEDKFNAPFRDGAVCIYPDQCDALFLRGGFARKSICPRCEVYEQCQQDGYLSQHGTVVGSEAIVIAMPDMFFNPNSQSFTDGLLSALVNNDGEYVEDKYGRVGVIDEAKAHEFYRICSLSRDQLKAWRDMWGEDYMLGMFAIDMLYMLETKGFEMDMLRKYITNIDNQIDGTAETIHRQMQHLLFPGEIIERGIKDPQSGSPWAHYSIRFENGTEVYIATTDYTYKALIKMEEFCVGPREYKKRDMIELTQEQAMRFGIYDVSQNRPEDYKKVAWVAGSSTHLHQLIAFFSHYVCDQNAPMFYDGESLQWYLPPTLHPNLKNLVMMSATLNLRHTKKSFPDEEDIAFIKTRPTKWKPGSKVFQIRTGVYPRRSLMDSVEQDDGGYKYTDLTDTGKKFFGFIEDNIKADPGRKHAIITFKQVMEWMSEDWMSKYDNLKFFGHFGKMEGLDEVFKDVKDYWIIGSPEVGREVIKHTAKLLFGNKEEPLNFERDDDKVFVDPDIQSVYEACVVALLQQAVGRARLNRIPDNRVFIFSGVYIPTVTDRPETLLFDFADCEIARSVNELEHWINMREREERNEDQIDDEILQSLMDGQTPSSLYRNEEYPERRVRKILDAYKDEIVAALADREEKMRERIRVLRDRGESWEFIKNDLGISVYKAKQLVG